MKIEILIDGEPYVELPKQPSDPMVTAWQSAIDHAMGGKCAWSAAYEALGVGFNRLWAECDRLRKLLADLDFRNAKMADLANDRDQLASALHWIREDRDLLLAERDDLFKLAQLVLARFTEAGYGPFAGYVRSQWTTQVGVDEWRRRAGL